VPTLWVTSGKIRLLLIPKSGKTASNIGCEYLVIIITNKQRRRRPRGLPWLSGFICAYHPAALGLNSKHTIDTFSTY